MPEENKHCKFMIPDNRESTQSSCISADRFCNIVENTGDAIITIDTQGNVTGWNHGAELIYQFKTDEILNKPLPILPDDKKSEFSDLLIRLKNGERISDFETQRKRKDGKILELSISFFPIKDRNDKIIEYCAIHRDITERKRLQQDMIRARELAAVGQLAAGIAHALNTPLASILISSQMLKDDNNNESVLSDIERIERQTERCKMIVKNLLNLSRPSSKLREPANINQLINSVLHSIEPTLKNKSIQMNINLEPEIPSFPCDPQSIEELISNLISNAGDSISRDGEIYIETKRNNGFILLSIRDTGKGIHPENLKRIFDPFFTTKEIGKGTGLGLAVCHRIVHDHHGTIEVESQPGMGTTFRIQLPVEESPVPVEAGL